MSETFELSITRLIDAPVDAVWRAWTAHMAEWFCPKPWTVEVHEADLRPGGRSAMTMRGPDGEANPIEGVYMEVLPGTRIVSTDAFAAGWIPQSPFMLRIDDFADENGKTRYTATARHWTAAAMEGHRAMGFETGWGIAADQLAEVARRLVAEGGR